MAILDDPTNGGGDSTDDETFGTADMSLEGVNATRFNLFPVSGREGESQFISEVYNNDGEPRTATVVFRLDGTRVASRTQTLEEWAQEPLAQTVTYSELSDKGFMPGDYTLSAKLKAGAEWSSETVTGPTITLRESGGDATDTDTTDGDTTDGGGSDFPIPSVGPLSGPQVALVAVVGVLIILFTV